MKNNNGSVRQCDVCKETQIVSYFDYPKVWPENLYDEFPEEQNKECPLTFKLCLKCIMMIGRSDASTVLLKRKENE